MSDKEWVEHIVEEGIRNHVLSWSEKGTRCSEPNCEVNRPPTPLVRLDEEKLEAFVHKWQNTNLFGDERISNIMISSLIKAISTKFGSPQDNKFINHIKSHLSEGQEVICKICGKTAKEICNE